MDAIFIWVLIGGSTLLFIVGGIVMFGGKDYLLRAFGNKPKVKEKPKQTPAPTGTKIVFDINGQKIKFEGGEIKTTPDHSLIILSEDFTLQPIKASKIKPGDLLITFSTRIEGSLRELDISEFKPTEFVMLKSGRVKNPTVKRVLDRIVITKNFAWLMGSFVAEGCAYLGKTSGTTIFTYGYPNEIEDAHKAIGVLNELGFPTSSHLIRSGTSGRMSALQVSLCSTQITKFLRRNFYVDGRKKVAHFIFNLPIELRQEFLKGYMGDACGAWGAYVRYASASPELLVDVAWLGRISGLDTSVFKGEVRIRWKKPGSYFQLNPS